PLGPGRARKGPRLRSHRGGDHQLDPSLANAGFCDGLSITVPEVMLRVRFADAMAVAAFERYLERLVRALVEITETYSPTVIVLGGTIGRLDDLYTPLAQALEHSLHRGANRPAVQKAAHGESSVIRGAAALWPINAG
ncbi:MAG: ROK family protein, partial [Myxococcota bacterium]